jgi:hypothetical protein
LRSHPVGREGLAALTKKQQKTALKAGSSVVPRGHRRPGRDRSLRHRSHVYKPLPAQLSASSYIGIACTPYPRRRPSTQAKMAKDHPRRIVHDRIELKEPDSNMSLSFGNLIPLELRWEIGRIALPITTSKQKLRRIRNCQRPVVGIDLWPKKTGARGRLQKRWWGKM